MSHKLRFTPSLESYQQSPNLAFWPFGSVTQIWILGMDLAGKCPDWAASASEIEIQTDEDDYITSKSLILLCITSHVTLPMAAHF